MPDVNNCGYSLLHTVSSTAVPASLIISSQVAAQSGEGMNFQTLQEYPVMVTFIVERVGYSDIQTSDHWLFIANCCVWVSFVYALWRFVAKYSNHCLLQFLCLCNRGSLEMSNSFVGSWRGFYLCILELLWAVSLSVSTTYVLTLLMLTKTS